MFGEIIVPLLFAAERPDVGNGKLRNVAFETLNALVRAAALDSFDNLNRLVEFGKDRLGASIQAAAAARQADNAQTQADLASLLLMLTQKLGERIAPHAQVLMTLYMGVFTSNSSTVHEETLQATGALMRVIKSHFAPYLPAFIEVLFAGLQNATSQQLCMVAVGVTVDLCHAELGPALLPFTDRIVTVLLNNLKNPNLPQDVRAPIISCFGDLAIAIGGEFEKYLATVMNMLAQASSTEVNSTHYELVEYINELRASIFEACTGILHGLEASHKQELFVPFVDAIVNFVGAIAQMQDRSDKLTEAACGIIGDFAKVLRPYVSNQLRKPFVNSFLQECASSQNPSISRVGLWARKQVHAVGR
eukprot:comp12918_c0_seq1/m.17340 comp12918_c0_seq1/g.17340  ORF comp12918_c0_seq1/g.17340 comp12918_c0_seq1/m.17340 type:complete len:362 (-) comp12918_c0_seq1:159-1244(-)